MRTINISDYNVYVGNVLPSVNEIIRSIMGDARIAFICDEKAYNFHGKALTESLPLYSSNSKVYILPSGEENKCLSKYADIIGFLSENGFSRTDAVVSFGGGATGDIAGFSASTYLRGIRYFHFPTTLLAAADASVGGKTAVNTDYGKNLCGTFYNPTAVFCHTPFLETLNAREINSGMAEIIKYGILFDEAFFDKLLYDNISYDEMIEKSVVFKGECVKGDEKDRGKRTLLNLGHTVGHAVEAESNFSLSHGEAVAIGTVKITEAAVKNGFCEKQSLEKIIEIYNKYSLPTDCPFSDKIIVDRIFYDKKRQGEKIKLVLPKKIGEAEIIQTDYDRLWDFFR